MIGNGPRVAKLQKRKETEILFIGRVYFVFPYSSIIKNQIVQTDFLVTKKPKPNQTKQNKICTIEKIIFKRSDMITNIVVLLKRVKMQL
jgi:hypothetical protein